MIQDPAAEQVRWWVDNGFDPTGCYELLGGDVGSKFTIRWLDVYDLAAQWARGYRSGCLAACLRLSMEKSEFLEA